MQFVIAALVIAVLLGDRLAPAAEMHRRFFQVGLAITLSLLISGLAILIFDVPSVGASGPLPVQGNQREDILQAFRDRQTFSLGAALLALIFGALAVSRSRTLYLAFVLAGLITLVTQAFDTSSTQALVPYLYSATGEASRTSDALYVAVLAIGALVLLLYGYQHWERNQSPSSLNALVAH